MGLPVYVFTSSTTFGTGIGSRTTSSSTFSGWGQMLGLISAPFNAVQIQMNPYDVNNLPSQIVINIRQMPDPSLWAAQNPASWPVVATSGQLAVNLPYNTFTTVTAQLSAFASSNLWLEVLANGYWTGNKVSAGVTNGPPWPAYVTGKALTTTNWVAGPSTNSFEFALSLGTNSTAITSFTGTHALADQVQAAAAVEIHLPVNAQNNLYALQGRELNLYFQNIIRSSIPLSSLNLAVSCAKEAQFQNWWRYTPLVGDAGTNLFTITVSTPDTSNVLASATCNLVTKIAASPSTPVTRKALMIGDSTMANGNPLAELVNLFNGDAKYTLAEIGSNTGSQNDSGGTSRAIACDSISGWSIGYFYTNSTSAWTQINGTNRTGSPFIFTNISSQFNFVVYLATNSLTLASNDWVFINLGINDVFNYFSDSALQAQITTNLAMLNGMITNISAAVPGVRVGLCLTIPPSPSQDGFGVNYPGGQTQARYRRNRDLWVEALLANYDSTTVFNVFVVPFNLNLDTVNNMQSNPVALNARNGVTYSQPSNGIHPANPGYYQLADTLQMFLKGKEN